MKLKTKIGLAAGTLGGVIIFAAFSVVYFGEGELHVIGPSDSAVAVALDGGEAVEVKAAEHRAWKLGRGRHPVQIRTLSTSKSLDREVFIRSGFTRLFVPANNLQCFVLLDVTNTVKAGFKRDGQWPLPKLKSRFTDGNPFEVSDKTFVSERELPDRIGRDETWLVLESLSCEKMASVDDRTLITQVLGYRGYE